MHRQSPEDAIAIACFTMREAIIKMNVNQNGNNFNVAIAPLFLLFCLILLIPDPFVANATRDLRPKNGSAADCTSIHSNARLIRMAITIEMHLFCSLYDTIIA